MDLSKDIQVSILCTVYNHEKYIRDCLNGFVMQQGVKFEVLIHDDASTDHSADIIREYESEYLDIIRPIYQSENQMSKGVNIYGTYLIPKVAGKYIALCEGDDYWTDPLKLKKQFEALESYPMCNFCTHCVQQIYASGEKTDGTYPGTPIPDGYISSSDFFKNIWARELYPFQTSSYFFRASEFIKYTENKPEFSRICDVGDVPWLLYFTYNGGVFYINSKMSYYRCAVPGSWSWSTTRESVHNKIRHYEATIKTYSSFYEYTNKSVDVSFAVNTQKYDICRLEKNYKGAFKCFLTEKNPNQKKYMLVLLLKDKCHWLYAICKKVKDRLFLKLSGKNIVK